MDDALDAPPDEVCRVSLAIAVDALAPSIYGVLPFFAIVALFIGHDAPSQRVLLWLASGLVATLVGMLAIRRYRATDVAALPWLHAAAATIGAAHGAAMFVPRGSAVEMVTAFLVVPVSGTAMYAVLTGPRRDLFASFQFTIAAVVAAGLFRTGDGRLVGLGACSLLFAVVSVWLHGRVHRAIVDAIRLDWTSKQLTARLRNEGAALGAANARLAATNEQLAHQAVHDPLTNLLNRRGTIEAIDALLERATPDDPVGLLYIDLDRFKQINDSLGHRGGDQFLTALSGRLSRALESSAVAGRIGGDEFLVALPGADVPTSRTVANRIVGVLGQPVHAEGREVPSSVSVGVAVGPLGGRTSNELMRHANAALHRAKSNGRNRIEIFDEELRDELVTRLGTEQELRRAIDANQIVPFFQPEIDATSGIAVGAELLARWLRADGTVLTASQFVGVAGQAGLLERMTSRVMVQARPHIRRLVALGLPEGFRFRVNLPPRATKRSWNENPLDMLIDGIDPNLLTVDVTESAVVEDLPAAAANLAAFRARGGRVCLDEFARGVSSLNLLRRLPLDEVRIDRSSIDALITHPHDRAIVRSIIALVRELNLIVTADGVETGAQADALIALGCTVHQGHLYRGALPAAQLETFLTERQARTLRLPHDGGWWRASTLTE